MTVRLKMFAVLREKAGISQTDLRLPDGATVEAALAEVGRQHPAIAALLSRAAAAVNLAYADRKAVLHDGDELALIPPVSGG